MANNFRNRVIKNIGVEAVEILTVGAAERATVVGLSLTNLVNSFVYVDILVKDDTSIEGFYLKETLLPANTSLRSVTNGEKLILAPNNVLSVRSSLDDSIDVILSYVETV
jgi:hypothetical protein